MERLRNYRINQEVRDKYAEVTIQTDELIQPFFVVEGECIKREIPSLKGIYHFSVDALLNELPGLIEAGIENIMLFGVINEKGKNEWGTTAYISGNVVEKAISEIKNKFPQLTIFTDVCLCGYTDHGHCGIIKGQEVDNDETLPQLAKMALNHARAGADFVCPSAMMDGQVQAIRELLDANQFQQVKILSYSAKYASNMYGPFREAAQSSPSFGDRKTYQMDYRTIQQGIREATEDVYEKADWIMVKPAHTYLDMITRMKQHFPDKKVAAYHVSGEYMLLKLAAEHHLVNEDLAIEEVLTAIKRAGADFIITYFAQKMAAKLSKKIQQQSIQNLTTQ